MLTLSQTAGVFLVKPSSWNGREEYIKVKLFCFGSNYEVLNLLATRDVH